MGKNTVQAKKQLDKCYPDSALLRQMVKKLFADFKRDRTNTDDVECTGRSNSAVVPENVKRVHKMVSADRKLKLLQIVVEVDTHGEQTSEDQTNVTNQHLFVGSTLIEYGNVPRDGAPASSVKKKKSSCTFACMHVVTVTYIYYKNPYKHLQILTLICGYVRIF